MTNKLARWLVALIVSLWSAHSPAETRPVTSISSDSRTANEFFDYLNRLPELLDSGVDDDVIEDKLDDFVQRLNQRKLQPAIVHKLIETLPTVGGEAKLRISEVLEQQAANYSLPDSALKQILQKRDPKLINMVVLTQRRSPLSTSLKKDLISWIQAGAVEVGSEHDVKLLLRLVEPEDLERFPQLASKLKTMFAKTDGNTPGSTAMMHSPHLMKQLAPDIPIPPPADIQFYSKWTSAYERRILETQMSFRVSDSEIESIFDRTPAIIRENRRHEAGIAQRKLRDRFPRLRTLGTHIAHPGRSDQPSLWRRRQCLSLLQQWAFYCLRPSSKRRNGLVKQCFQVSAKAPPHINKPNGRVPKIALIWLERSSGDTRETNFERAP